MTIESPKQKRGGTNQKTEARRRKQKKQKRGGASRPKDNSVIPPFDSAACAARLLCPTLLSYRPPSRYPVLPDAGSSPA